MKQLIIVRKDLNMSMAKFAVQCCHASMAFIKEKISRVEEWRDNIYHDDIDVFRKDVVELSEDDSSWFDEIQTKIICEAKNKNKLLKCIDYATEIGLKENEDYFIIRDRCLTELTPEEVDEEGNYCTITAIGFRPLPNEVVSQISKHYQLYK